MEILIAGPRADSRVRHREQPTGSEAGSTVTLTRRPQHLNAGRALASKLFRSSHRVYLDVSELQTFYARGSRARHYRDRSRGGSAADA